MIHAFLVGGRGGGGEEVFLRDLVSRPPEGVVYHPVWDHHESIPEARCARLGEVLLNRLVHPLLWPLPGFRAYRVASTVDLVHLHNFPAWLGLPRGCPVVSTVGGAGYPHYMEAYLGWAPGDVEARYRRARRLYRLLRVRSELATHEGVDAVVVFSPYAADRLASLGLPRGKIHVIPPGFDIPAPATPPSSEPFTFLLVGRDPARKGADLAVAALQRLREQGVDARLVLVGDAAYPAMAAGVEGVEGVGPVDRDTLFRDFFGRAHAVLVPSRAEGFGFTAVEGMGHGLPVVASRRDTLPWIVGDGGLLVDPGDAGSLGEAMARLATDPSTARALGESGRRRFEAVFTRVRVREELGSLYRSLLDGKA